MARCRAYVIQGPDSPKIASTVLCRGDSAGWLKVDGKSFPVCKKRRGKAWNLFMKDGGLYAVKLNARK